MNKAANTIPKFKNIYTFGSFIIVLLSGASIYSSLLLIKYHYLYIFECIILFFGVIITGIILLQIYTDWILKRCERKNIDNNIVYIMGGTTVINKKNYNFYNAAVTVSLLPRIIITDSLFNILNDDELKAVIDHEAGHIKFNHIIIIIFYAISYGMLIALFDFALMYRYIFLYIPEHLIFFGILFVDIISIFLSVIAIKTLFTKLELEADSVVSSKNSFNSALNKIKNAYIDDVIKRGNKIKEHKILKFVFSLFDPHMLFEKRIQKSDYNINSMKNVFISFFPFALFISLDITIYIFMKSVVYNYFYSLLLSMYFISFLIGLTLIIPLIYYIFNSAGFAWNLTRISLMAYITISSIEIIYNGLINDLITNVIATVTSIYLISINGGRFKAILIWVLFFVISLFVGGTWILIKRL